MLLKLKKSLCTLRPHSSTHLASKLKGNKKLSSLNVCLIRVLLVLSKVSTKSGFTIQAFHKWLTDLSCKELVTSFPQTSQNDKC